jgi:hypothetical protein
MLKYENKKRMIHREFLNYSLFIFLRISGIINVFLQGLFLLVDVGGTIHAHQVKSGYWGLCSNETKSRNKH